MPLAPGDSLILYTDGITEAMNADGRALRLAAAADAARPRRRSASSLLGRRILDDVKRFVGNRRQSDDMCLTCFGRYGGM